MALSKELAADLVLVNGRVLTMDTADREVQAVAIKDGKVMAVGSNQEVEALAGAGAEGIDLKGRVALPGLADVHVHLATDASSAGMLNARDFFDSTIRSIPDIQARIRERAAQLPPGEWIVARGSPMQDFRLVERRFPTKAELDAAAPNHPCSISFGAHVTVANTQALKARNITPHTPSPLGGTVVKDPTTGEPTGVLRERAQFLLKAGEAGREVESLSERILLELEKCAARGVTTIHDVIINRDEVRAYQLLARDGRLPVRVHLLLRVIESSFSKESLLDLGFLHGFGSDMLRVGGIKMSIDGGFTGKNAAFSEPLSHHGEDNPGLIRIDQEELDDTVWRYHELGMRICVHAMGDVAMDMILQAYDKAITRLPRQDHRHRVEHLGNWMMSPQRIQTARRLGILPVPNPSFFYFLGSQVLETLGPERANHCFPSRTLLDAGFPLAYGADAPGYWPVDPLRDLGSAVSRITVDGLKLSPEEAITVREGLRGQTANAAWLGFQERNLGTLEPGKLADIAVMAEDPFTFSPERFRELPFDVTITAGKVVHAR